MIFDSTSRQFLTIFFLSSGRLRIERPPVRPLSRRSPTPHYRNLDEFASVSFLAKEDAQMALGNESLPLFLLGLGVVFLTLFCHSFRLTAVSFSGYASFLLLVN